MLITVNRFTTVAPYPTRRPNWYTTGGGYTPASG